MMTPLERTYLGKPVLVTGHTGFKGGWLSVWLKALGAKVIGLSLPPEGTRDFFLAATVPEGMASLLGDVRDFKTVARVLHDHEPELVFHLAAQPLVRKSHREPVDTFATNVLGTVNLLEAVRWTPSVRAVVVVTSDKCYENPEDGAPRKETDPMGGHDPYSASKGAAELAASSFYQAFFKASGVGMATARAGNVIGGGDWAEDRIVPDCVRALEAGQRVPVRNPDAIRPWQHVLEPASGYLWLGARLLAQPTAFSGGWNFGPDGKDRVPVGALVHHVLDAWGAPHSRVLDARDPKAPREATSLVLDPAKAKAKLGWQAAWSVPEAVQATVDWYKASLKPGFDGERATRGQIQAYGERAAALGIAWASASAPASPSAKTPARPKRGSLQ